MLIRAEVFFSWSCRIVAVKKKKSPNKKKPKIKKPQKNKKTQKAPQANIFRV